LSTAKTAIANFLINTAINEKSTTYEYAILFHRHQKSSAMSIIIIILLCTTFHSSKRVIKVVHNFCG